jgi:nucleoid-associated protein YgaU
LNQVSEEAAQTTLENIEIAASVTTGTVDGKATSGQANEVDLDQLSQLVAVRLSELLDTKTKADAKGLPISLETVVSDALHDGKQMDEVRSAVTQAMTEVTGQNLQLDSPKTKQAVTNQSSSNSTIESSSETTNREATTSLTEAALKQANTSVGETSQNGQSNTITTTTVLPGESLFRVAQRVYGEENGRRFLDIFAANRDIIKDINIVHEGLVLKLPQPINVKPVLTPTQ